MSTEANTVVDAGACCPAYRWSSMTGEVDDEVRQICLLVAGHSGAHDWDDE